MIDIKFKPCCDECQYRKTYIKEDKFYSENRPYDITTVIGCEHEDVCKEYCDEKV